jgi:hypothetical protein
LKDYDETELFVYEESDVKIPSVRMCQIINSQFAIQSEKETELEHKTFDIDEGKRLERQRRWLRMV